MRERVYRVSYLADEVQGCTMRCFFPPSAERKKLELGFSLSRQVERRCLPGGDEEGLTPVEVEESAL